MSENTELIPIVGTENDNRTADIIFVHGLGGDALETWHPQGKKEAKNSWLTWLGEDFKDMGIWSVAYEVEPFRWKGSTMPLLMQALEIAEATLGENHPNTKGMRDNLNDCLRSRQ